MIHPRIDELMDKVDSRYALVIVAAKRARQINNYHHQLGEGTFDEFAPPLIESRSKNYLTMSLEEIAEGKIVYEYPKTAEEVPAGTIPGMSRILLGVTGGIAAYKACELTRLLVKAGHEVIPLVTEGAQRFVTEETFLALARRPRNEDVYPHLTRADLLVVAPVHREHAREARARDRRQRPDRGRARAPRPDPRRARDEPAHVGGSRRRARTSRRCSRAASSSSAPTRARWPRASGASAGSPSRPRSPARDRAAARARLARRPARSWSPPAARASRSTACASSATAPRAAWASRSPRRRAAAAPR